MIQSSVKQLSAPYVSDAFEPSPRTAATAVTSQLKTLPPLSSSASSQSISVTVAPPTDAGYINLDFGQDLPKSDTYLVHDTSDSVKQNTLPLPPTYVDMDNGRRRSYDDGVRPLNILFGRKSETTQQLPDTPLTAPVISEGLTVASSRRIKRHSINSGLSPSDTNATASTPTLSPTPSRPSRLVRQSSTSPTPTGSPLHEYLDPQSPSSRPASRSGSGLTHPSPQLSSALLHAEVERQESPRSSTPSIHLNESDQTIIVKPSSPSTVILDSAPLPKARARVRPFDEPNADEFKSRNSSSLNSDLNEVDVVHSPRSYGYQQPRYSHSDPARLSDSSLNSSRSISPAHRVDVPQNVESETDTEAENDNDAQRSQIRESEPPIPPPKEDHLIENSDADLDMSLSQLDNGPDDTESSPVQQVSHSTFIAPALPPIRFSLNTADFSELFNSVGGLPSIKSMDHLAKLSEEIHGKCSPPPTATFEANLTSTSNTTVISIVDDISRDDSETTAKKSLYDDRNTDWFVFC